MPMWQVVLLLNLTLVVGLAFGYGVWGHRLAALDGRLSACRCEILPVLRPHDRASAELCGLGHADTSVPLVGGGP
jgi:hypothetical protein